MTEHARNSLVPAVVLLALVCLCLAVALLLTLGLLVYRNRTAVAPPPTAALPTVPPTALGQGWGEQILSGETFLVVLDETRRYFDDQDFDGDWRTDPLGTIQGGRTYSVTYSAATGWTVTGYNEQIRRVLRRTYPATCVAPESGRICLWGAIFSFNDEGEVYHEKYGLVGHLSK